MNILIYDNEWKHFLEELPYNLTFAYNEDDVYKKTFNKDFDLYIFDFEEGYIPLFNLRESGDKTLAIFLSNIETFQAQNKAYKIADDFFKKRCTYIEEIKIKIEYIKKKFLNLDKIIKYKNFYINTQKREVYKEHKKIKLTNLEYDLLVLFFKYKNQYIPKYDILDKLQITDGSLRVKISNLRRLGFCIENKKNLGYKLKEEK